MRPTLGGESVARRFTHGDAVVVVHHLALSNVPVLGAGVEELGGDVRLLPDAVADAERVIGLDLEHGDRVPDAPHEPPAVPPAGRGHGGVAFDCFAFARCAEFVRFPHGNLLASGANCCHFVVNATRKHTAKTPLCQCKKQKIIVSVGFLMQSIPDANKAVCLRKIHKKLAAEAASFLVTPRGIEPRLKA